MDVMHGERGFPSEGEMPRCVGCLLHVDLRPDGLEQPYQKAIAAPAGIQGFF